MKKLLATIIVLAVAAAGGAFYAFDSLLKSGIETAGSRVLQTGVTVGAVAVSPLSGNGGIQELKIANPAGFSAPYAMELGGLDVGVEVGSVLSDVVVIDHILINDPVITYESRITTDNIRTLLGNLGSRTGQQPAQDESAETGKRVIIRDFQMLGPRVNVSSTLGSAEITIPDLRLQNIGSDNAAVTVAEAGRQIFAALNQELIAADLPNVEMIRGRVDEEVQALRDRAGQQVEQLEQQVEEQVENLRERARSLF